MNFHFSSSVNTGILLKLKSENATGLINKRIGHNWIGNPFCLILVKPDNLSIYLIDKSEILLFGILWLIGQYIAYYEQNSRFQCLMSSSDNFIAEYKGVKEDNAV